MYNMEISIGSYKCRLEICILAFVLFWIMFGHVMCSCCTMSMQEGFDMMKSMGMSKKEGYAPRARRAANMYDANHITSNETFVAGAPRVNRYDANHTSEEEEGMRGRKEGFVSSNNKAYGPEFESSKAPGYIMRPDTWAMPTLSYSKGTTPSAGAQDILNRNNPPLNEGEMDMFANTPFKPECCPSAFSTSTGCACMDMKQYNSLITRFSNNVPYSEY
jgi:uncharacterized protein (DUF2147 family)